MKKKSKNGELILIKSFIDKKENLTKEENKLRDELILIEDKLNSVKKILSSMESGSVLNDSTVHSIVDSIAISKMMELLEGYFEI